MMLPRAKRLGLDSLHAVQQLAVVRCPVRARMNSPVAVRAQRDHKSRVVWPTIAEPSNVVWFEIGNAVCPKERSRLVTAFAVPLCASDNVVPHISAAFEHRGDRLTLARRGIGGGEGSAAQLCEIHIRRCLALYNFDNVGDGPELENNGIAHFAGLVRRALNMVPFADILVLEAKAIWRLAEEEEACAVSRMVCDPCVSALHHHVAQLALAKVLEDAISALSISISVDEPFSSGDDENHMVVGGRDNSALLLPPKASVNFSAAIIDTPPLEPPRHRRSPACCVSAVVPPLSCAPVNRMVEAAE